MIAMSTSPSPAATIVLLRDSPEGVEVYLVRRPAGASFMAGAHVFPGGRIEPADHDPALLARADGVGPLRARLEAAGATEPLHRVEAAGLAAVRELFEEAGILLARLPSGLPPGDDALAAWRVARGTSSDRGHHAWPRLLDAIDARPALDRLVVLARWITPEAERRRFDTWFFVAPCPEGQTPHPDGEEAVDGVWLRPSEAVAGHDEGRVQLAPPTLRTLEDLAARDEPSAGALMQALAGVQPPTILPHLIEAAGRRLLVLPGDSRYPGGAAVQPAPAAFVFDGERWRTA
jgi:8-oxo-dGTP pyrophosphatase MutT (NUDIX family)